MKPSRPPNSMLKRTVSTVYPAGTPPSNASHADPSRPSRNSAAKAAVAQASSSA